MSTLFNDLMQGWKEVEAYMAGAREGYRVHVPADGHAFYFPDHTLAVRMRVSTRELAPLATIRRRSGEDDRGWS